jgi:2-polyprenyl-3-methyl-5-hydroxy-6-metoxy-1,4-benzoquinol methylase
LQDVTMIADRSRVAELMDEPGLDPALHRQALAGLRRINRLSRCAATLWPFVREAARRVSPQPVRVLDLACGSGDNMLALAQLAERTGVSVECAGCDVSPMAVETARLAARNHGVAAVSFFQCNVLEEPLPTDYHVLTCSLFLHHLSEEQAVDLLRRIAAATRDLVLISDLRRTRLGMTLAWLAGHALTRSPVVAVDESEVAWLARRSGLAGFRLVRRWPQRWVLSWRKS